jgi:cation diffusion facilitator family transporter
MTASLAVMVVTMGVNLAVSIGERRRGTRLGSEILTADAAHTGSDVFVSLGVLGSLLAARWGYPQLDVVAALVITAIIARIAFRILRRSAERLVDPAILPVERVREVALAVPGVRGAHKIRTRASGGHGHADLHVQLAPDLRLDEAHALGHRVADRLREELGLADVLVHVEPAGGPGGDSPADESPRG